MKNVGQSSKPLCRHSNDRIGRVIDLRQVFRRNADHRHAASLKPSIAADIALRTNAHIVTHSVNLDGEACLRAVEVEHVRSNRMLAAKHRLARSALAQTTLEPRFGE